jgi:RNA polymerase-binding transcription factor DksA
MHYHYFTLEQRANLEREIRERMATSPDCAPTLERLHAPDYGVCSSCGADIPYAALMASPGAVLCAACLQKEKG